MKPVDHQAIEIAQAERFDVVVDFSADPVGTNVTLTNQFGEGSVSQVMRFHVVRQARDESAVPAHLSSFQTLRRSDAAITRQFNFNQGNRDVWMINGKPFDPRRMDARPRLGTTEIWRLTTDQHHPVHLQPGLNAQELARILAVIPGDHLAGLRLRALILASLLTGRRRQAVLWLRWRDLDLEGSFYRYRGKGG